MKKYLYLSTILVVFVSLVVPVFVCSEDFAAYITLSATLLAALCTLLTLIIAIKLYDRFSLEREMAAKQFDEVLKLKNNLLRHNMPFFWKDDNGKVKTTWISADGSLPELPVELLDKKRLFWSYDAFGEYSECVRDIEPLLLPEEVGACFNRLPGRAWGINEPSFTVNDAVNFIGSSVGHPDWRDDDRLWEDARGTGLWHQLKLRV